MNKNTRVTGSRIRESNRKFVLRAIYTQTVNNRAALAEETGLAKPTISALVAELMEEGLLAEEGFGESTESGGKRPRLLRFIPEARQVIGIALHQQYVHGVLANLDRRILLEHRADLPSTQQTEVFSVLVEVINGLIAQLSAPLLCLSVGIPAVVDDEEGIVRHAPRFDWYNVALAAMLNKHYDTTVYISNSPELAAKAQFEFNKYPEVGSLATVLISNSVGFGMVNRASSSSTGNDIGHLLLRPGVDSDVGATVEQLLGWPSVHERTRQLANAHRSLLLDRADLTYLHIRYAIAQNDPAALALQDELTSSIAQIFSWVITLMRPDHLSLAGAMATLGESFLQVAIDKTCKLILPDLVKAMTFSVDETQNLVAVGAVAKAIEDELGIV